jgi:SDR family mycofactocin-dependent oxidoreductase
MEAAGTGYRGRCKVAAINDKESHMGRVDGKVAVITGAGRGQGRSHAVTLASEGADIIAVDICAPVDSTGYDMSTPEDLAETGRLVEEQDRRVVTVQADVRDLPALRRGVEDGVATLGRLDIVCANAGICIAGSWDSITPDEWADTIAINLTGVWNTCVATIGHLIKAGGGSIVITSSYAGLRGAPFLAPYAASKHGVVGLARELANELADNMIRVNTIHPTGVNGTSMGVHALFPLLEKHPKMAISYQNALPVESVELSDISNAVLYLASDESRYVTGITLPIDAGVTNL